MTGKEKLGGTDGPSISVPCSLDAGDGVVEVVVVINNVSILEMLFIWLRMAKKYLLVSPLNCQTLK